VLQHIKAHEILKHGFSSSNHRKKQVNIPDHRESTRQNVRATLGARRKGPDEDNNELRIRGFVKADGYILAFKNEMSKNRQTAQANK
jgi:hypothetical protein